MQQWCPNAQCSSRANVDFNNPCNEQGQTCNCLSGWTGQYCTQRKFGFQRISTKFSWGEGLWKMKFLQVRDRGGRGCKKNRIYYSVVIYCGDECFKSLNLESTYSKARTVKMFGLFLDSLLCLEWLIRC